MTVNMIYGASEEHTCTCSGLKTLKKTGGNYAFSVRKICSLGVNVNIRRIGYFTARILN